MGSDMLAFGAVATLLLAVSFAFVVNTGFARRSGMSAQRAARRAEGHAELLLGCCAALPWVALCSAYTLALRAWLTLGHWPRPMINDPKSFGWPVHHAAAFVLENAALMSVFAVVALLIVFACRDIKPAHAKASLLVFAAGYALFWGLLVADPGRVNEWLAD